MANLASKMTDGITSIADLDHSIFTSEDDDDHDDHDDDESKSILHL